MLGIVGDFCQLVDNGTACPHRPLIQKHPHGLDNVIKQRILDFRSASRSVGDRVTGTYEETDGFDTGGGVDHLEAAIFGVDHSYIWILRVEVVVGDVDLCHQRRCDDCLLRSGVHAGLQ